MQTTEETQGFTPQTCSPEELVTLLDSHGLNGLTRKQARYRLHQKGKNLFRKEFSLRPTEDIKGQIRGMVNLLYLAVMLVLYLFLQDSIYLLSLGVGVLVLMAGAVWELAAARILHKREKYSALGVQVVRDGKTQRTDSRLLVPGDLLYLESGNLVPADARILEDDGKLSALETPVSGVRSAVKKSCRLPAKAEEAVSGNMVYAGTLITGGTCLAMVCRTGDDTLLRQIRTPKKEYLPPLLDHAREYCRMLSLAGLLGCFAISVVGALCSISLSTLLALSVASAAVSLCDVALALACLSFAKGLTQMEKGGVIVHNLDKLNRLARVDTVMCPKELTFPPKKPFLDSVFAGGKLYSAEEPPSHEVQEVLKLTLACSDYPRSLRGYENVTAAYLRDKCIPLTELTEEWFRVDTGIGSEGEVNAVISLNKDHYRVVVKGAPEAILARCAGYETDGREYKMTPEAKKKILDAAQRASRNMAYLVAVASGITEEDSLRSPFAERRLIFRGFLAFRLSMEVDMAGGIYRASKAGIECVLSTDDPYYTAAGIAKSVGIISHEGEMISSEEIAASDRGMYVLNSGKYKVFLEPTEEQWLDVLRLRKEAGRTVLATGTEDTHLPLLREADISAVPAGEKDILRESADLVMTENGFQVFAEAIAGAKMLYFRLRWLLQLLTAGVCSWFICLLIGIFAGGIFPFGLPEVLLGGVAGNLALASVVALFPMDRAILQQKVPVFGRKTFLRELLPPMLIGICTGGILFLCYFLTGSSACLFPGALLSQFLYACGCLYEEGAIRRKRFGCRPLWILLPVLVAYCGLLLCIPALFALPTRQQLLTTGGLILLWHGLIQLLLFFKSKNKKIK